MGLGTGVAVLNSQIVLITQVALKTGSTVLMAVILLDDLIINVPKPDYPLRELFQTTGVQYILWLYPLVLKTGKSKYN